jgi:integrase
MSTGSIRQRSPGSWSLKYDVGRNPRTGRRITRYATVRGTKRDAQRALRELLGAVDDGTHVDPGKLTVGQWLKQWLDEARHTVSRKTHERYTGIVNQHLVPALGALELAKFAPVHIQSFYSDALSSGRLDGNGGLSPQTVVHFGRVLNKAMKRAKKLRLIASNPVEDATPPRVEEKEMQTLTDEQAAKLLAAASTTRLYVPIVVALATGLRRGELVGLAGKTSTLTPATSRLSGRSNRPRKGCASSRPRRSEASGRSYCQPARPRCCAPTRWRRPRSGWHSGSASAS